MRRLAIILDRLGWRFCQLDLVIHGLDFRVEIFQSRGKILLLLRDFRFELLDLLVLFEELIEQHRVHRVVANAVGLSEFIADDQVWINFRYFFGNQSELWSAIVVALVVERHRFERKDGIAVFRHRVNVLFESLRRANRSELAVGVDHDRNRRSAGARPEDAIDKSAQLTRKSDANSVRFAGISIARDVDVVVSGRKTEAGLEADGDIEA